MKKHVPALLIAAALLAIIGLIIANFLRERRQWDLSSAARAGDLVTVKRCVQAGVSIDAEPVSEAGGGSPAFVAAAWGGHDDVIMFLLDNGANINRRDSSGNTALNAAVIRGHVSTARLLLGRGADPNIPGEGSPLWNADSRGDAELAKLLRANGATQ